MRKIEASRITEAVRILYSDINYILPPDIEAAFGASLSKENNKTARNTLKVLIENARIARKELIPICQDTGLAVVFMEIGQDVHITGGDIRRSVDQGIRDAVKGAYLRCSVVKSPVERINTKDNAPAILHTSIVPGNKIRITVAAKGAGSENMSALKMLKPADGIEGIKEFVLETVRNAGPNPCPPIVVGVGIGGNFETSALLAKKALMRDIRKRNPDKNVSKLEKELLDQINRLGIGPSGFGGKTTAFAVNIETLPCHIASLPVAVNIECHAHRHASFVI